MTHAPDAVDVAARVLGPLARRDEPIGPRTTYRVGGRAALFVELEEEIELPTVADAIAASGVEVFVLGKGSNTLVAEGGFGGLVLTLGSNFAEVALDPIAHVATAGAAVALPVLARTSAAAGMRGLEWYVGIPGSVGGAVRMNAGGHGAETLTCLLDARIFRLDDAREGIRDVATLDFGYRTSALRPLDLVLEARFSTTPGARTDAARVIDEIVSWRREHQPGGRNGGSVFTNPVGDSAGRLIDSAGLKGLRVGSAYVSEKHANFFGVDEGGSADDVKALIDIVHDRVAERTGVDLVTEIRCIGFGP